MPSVTRPARREAKLGSGPGQWIPESASWNHHTVACVWAMRNAVHPKTKVLVSPTNQGGSGDPKG